MLLEADRCHPERHSTCLIGFLAQDLLHDIECHQGKTQVRLNVPQTPLSDLLEIHEPDKERKHRLHEEAEVALSATADTH